MFTTRTVNQSKGIKTWIEGRLVDWEYAEDWKGQCQADTKILLSRA